MVGPTPEGNPMNTDRCELHSARKTTTTSRGYKRKSGQNANRRGERREETHETLISQMNADYLRSPSKEIREWCLNRWLARTRDCGLRAAKLG